MKCYHPVKGFRTPSGVVFSALARYDIRGEVEIPCGQCIGCRERRASDWELRCMHEASLWPSNCFVTLTYGRDCVPTNGSLSHEDFQLFMKRLRARFHPRPVRFYMCGEYGPENGRPHYHACLFNVDFDDRVPSGKSKSGEVFYDSKLLSELWGHGRVSVQDLTRETAGYCARYIMKKRLGHDAKYAYDIVLESGEVLKRRPEYSACSLKPGIGARWFDRFSRDVFPKDYVIANGAKRRPPKYYDKLLKRQSVEMAEDVCFARELRARKLDVAEKMDARLAVQEVVHTAKVRNQLRSLDHDAS